MTGVEILNFSGLLLNFFGGLMLFRYGPPQPSFTRVALFGLSLSPEEDKKIKRQETRHTRLSKAGLAIIIFGFVLQLIAARPICAGMPWTCAVSP